MAAPAQYIIHCYPRNDIRIWFQIAPLLTALKLTNSTFGMTCTLGERWKSSPATTKVALAVGSNGI